ncbi:MULTISPECIES: barstar family protein [Amycolatopsis]|uniref:Barstar family protein n=1 Tax=Amycolatopsis albidoflavus TaxID=102226 RepID=A0ABW5I2H0_9PSEU
MKMNIRTGVTHIDSVRVNVVDLISGEADGRVFILNTGPGRGSAPFFDAVRAVFPLNPPVVGSNSWDSLSDSLWQGLFELQASRIIVWWEDARLFKKNNPSEYEIALGILSDISGSLADSRATQGRVKRVSILVSSN